MRHRPGAPGIVPVCPGEPVSDRSVEREEVRLTMPATPEYLRVARLTAAGLAGRMGFSYDEVEDLRIAVDELCFLLVGTKGRDGTLELVYELLPDAITIQGTGRFETGTSAIAPSVSDLSQQILAAVVDEHDVDGAGQRFRLTKRRTAY